MHRTLSNLGSLAIAAAGVIGAASCSPAPPPVPSAPQPSSSAAASAPVSPAPEVRVAFEIPRNGAPSDLSRTPWPTEMARLPDGHIDLRSYPGRDSPLLAEYLARAAEDLDGFSVAPVVYFRFEGPIDLDALAADDTSRSPRSAIALVDVDPKSPEKGTFYPLALHATGRDMRYVKKGTLAVRPLDGFLLRPGTLYAAVVRRSFGGVRGGLRTSPDLDAVLSTTPRPDPAEERARSLHAPALDALDALGVARSDIAALAVFRTGVPHALADKLLGTLDAMFASAPPAASAPKSSISASTSKTPSISAAAGASLAPRIVRAEWDPSLSVPGLYRAMRGAYCTPNFQARVENAPFVEREGGRVLTGSDGAPLVAPVPESAPFASPECPGQIRARFVLSVPEAPMPSDGYPLLVTAHGTGGDALTFLGRNDFAGWAAQEGFAAISTDQPLNGGKEGGRPGAAGPLVLPMGIPLESDVAGPPVAFYNPLYPGAAGGNMEQAVADAAVLVRLFGGLDLGALRTAANKPLVASRKGETAPRFDARRTLLAGHSQGCQSLAVLGGIDPKTRGVLLSGCGGDLRFGLLHRRIASFAPWITLTLGLDPEELTVSHPLMALVRNLADPVDPIAYARYYWDPLPGRRPQKVLLFEGLRDGYSPEIASEALAVALRARPLAPLVKPIARLDLLPSPGNADRAIVQFAPKLSPDGHFVLYHERGASDDFRAFLQKAGAL
jgi:hypothetical protein